MPVQALIRKMTRAQVDKMIADSKQKLVVRDHDGTMLVMVESQAEGGDRAANAVLQKIADTDAAILQKELQEAAEKAAAERAAKAAGG